jgi:hypothetical protein
MGGRMADTFKPGDKVERSGIYRVIHDPYHSQENEVTRVFGKLFPPFRFSSRDNSHRFRRQFYEIRSTIRDERTKFESLSCLLAHRLGALSTAHFPFSSQCEQHFSCLQCQLQIGILFGDVCERAAIIPQWPSAVPRPIAPWLR